MRYHLRYHRKVNPRGYVFSKKNKKQNRATNECFCYRSKVEFEFSETACSHVESLDRKLKNVHRRMAGKLCGPSSSKASPASTPIPLGTAKHKILKSNDKYYTYLYTFARAHTQTHTYALRTDTHDYLRQKYLARKSARVPAKSLSSKQERRNDKERNG